MSYWSDIEAGMAYLDERTQEYERDILAAANAEAEYRKAKALALAEERAKGTPATIMRDLIFIRPEIQKAFLERATTAAIADADREAINTVKKKLQLLDAQEGRDWQAAGVRGY